MSAQPGKKRGHMLPARGAVAQLGPPGPPQAGRGAGHLRHINSWLKTLPRPGTTPGPADLAPEPSEGASSARSSTRFLHPEYEDLPASAITPPGSPRAPPAAPKAGPSGVQRSADMFDGVTSVGGPEARASASLNSGVLMATMPKPRVTGAVSVFGGKENALPGAGRAPTGPGAEPSQASEGPRDDAGVEGTAGVGPSGSVVRKSRNVPIPGPTGPIAPVTGTGRGPPPTQPPAPAPGVVSNPTATSNPLPKQAGDVAQAQHVPETHTGAWRGLAADGASAGAGVRGSSAREGNSGAAGKHEDRHGESGELDGASGPGPAVAATSPRLVGVGGVAAEETRLAAFHVKARPLEFLGLDPRKSMGQAGVGDWGASEAALAAAAVILAQAEAAILAGRDLPLATSRENTVLRGFEGVTGSKANIGVRGGQRAGTDGAGGGEGGATVTQRQGRDAGDGQGVPGGARRAWGEVGGAAEGEQGSSNKGAERARGAEVTPKTGADAKGLAVDALAVASLRAALLAACERAVTAEAAAAVHDPGATAEIARLRRRVADLEARAAGEKAEALRAAEVAEERARAAEAALGALRAAYGEAQGQIKWLRSELEDEKAAMAVRLREVEAGTLSLRGLAREQAEESAKALQAVWEEVKRTREKSQRAERAEQEALQKAAAEADRRERAEKAAGVAAEETRVARAEVAEWRGRAAAAESAVAAERVRRERAEDAERAALRRLAQHAAAREAAADAERRAAEAAEQAARQAQAAGVATQQVAPGQAGASHSAAGQGAVEGTKSPGVSPVRHPRREGREGREREGEEAGALAGVEDVGEMRRVVYALSDAVLARDAADWDDACRQAKRAEEHLRAWERRRLAEALGRAPRALRALGLAVRVFTVPVGGGKGSAAWAAAEAVQNSLLHMGYSSTLEAYDAGQEPLSAPLARVAHAVLFVVPKLPHTGGKGGGKLGGNGSLVPGAGRWGGVVLREAALHGARVMVLAPYGTSTEELRAHFGVATGKGESAERKGQGREKGGGSGAEAGDSGVSRAKGAEGSPLREPRTEATSGRLALRRGLEDIDAAAAVALERAVGAMVSYSGDAPDLQLPPGSAGTGEWDVWEWNAKHGGGGVAAGQGREREKGPLATHAVWRLGRALGMPDTMLPLLSVDALRAVAEQRGRVVGLTQVGEGDDARRVPAEVASMDLCHLSSAPTDLRLKLTPAAQGIPGLTQALCDVIAGNVAVESMTIAGAPMRCAHAVSDCAIHACASPDHRLSDFGFQARTPLRHICAGRLATLSLRGPALSAPDLVLLCRALTWPGCRLSRITIDIDHALAESIACAAGEGVPLFPNCESRIEAGPATRGDARVEVERSRSGRAKAARGGGDEVAQALHQDIDRMLEESDRAKRDAAAASGTASASATASASVWWDLACAACDNPHVGWFNGVELVRGVDGRVALPAVRLPAGGDGDGADNVGLPIVQARAGDGVVGGRAWAMVLSGAVGTPGAFVLAKILLDGSREAKPGVSDKLGADGKRGQGSGVTVGPTMPVAALPPPGSVREAVARLAGGGVAAGEAPIGGTAMGGAGAGAGAHAGLHQMNDMRGTMPDAFDEVKLDGLDCGPLGATAVIAALRKSGYAARARALTVRGVLLGTHGSTISELASLLRDSKSTLAQVTIASCGLGDVGVAGIAPALVLCSAVESLSLASNAVSIDGVKDLSKALAAATEPRLSPSALFLAGNALGNPGTAAVAALAAKWMPRLTSLDLADHYNIAGEGVRALWPLLVPAEGEAGEGGAGAVRAGSGVGEGSLGGKGAGSATRSGAESAPAASAPPRLAVLDLSRNHLGADGARALAKALGGGCLRELVLDRCRLRSEGLTALLPSLAEDRALRSLSLARNKLGDRDVAALAKAVRDNAGLARLDISGNTFGADGARFLEAALRARPVPLDLVLRESKLDAATVARLQDAAASAGRARRGRDGAPAGASRGASLASA